MGFLFPSHSSGNPFQGSTSFRKICGIFCMELFSENEYIGLIIFLKAKYRILESEYC